MRKILFAFSFILALYTCGQNKIEISVQQDARLFLVGDQKGNDPLTANLLSKIEVPIYNFKKKLFGNLYFCRIC
jgi:hypothetical protein